MSEEEEGERMLVWKEIILRIKKKLKQDKVRGTDLERLGVGVRVCGRDKKKGSDWVMMGG